MSKLRVFEAFCGVGSQSMALRNLGIEHEVVGVSEIDIDAIISYAAIKDVDLNKDITMLNKAIDKLEKMKVGFNFITGKSRIKGLSKVKKKMLINANEGINNFGDISNINPNELPDMDLFTYSFPCQDLSIAGAQSGLSEGTRSGLLYECEKVIEAKRPKYLLLENVKNLVGKKFKNDFDKWLNYLERLGYTNYWEVLNAKDYGVPQNRERVFVVSILYNDKDYEFPKKIKLDKYIKDILESEVEEKYYMKKEYKLVSKGHIAEVVMKGNESMKRVYDVNSYAPCVNSCQGGNLEPKTLLNGRIRKLTPLECWRLMSFLDEDFYKVKNVGMSNSQLYKQAGNSIVVKVLEGIFKNLFIDNNKEFDIVEDVREDNNIQMMLDI